jgi:phosphoserine phosphatase
MTGERRRRVLVDLSAKRERGPVRLFAALIRLAAFDLDGTIVREGTCVESIARAIGREEECAAFERLEMRDVLAVTAAREAMAKWYRPYT